MFLHQIKLENEMLTDFPVNPIQADVQDSLLFQHHLLSFVSHSMFTIVDDARNGGDGG